MDSILIGLNFEITCRRRRRHRQFHSGSETAIISHKKRKHASRIDGLTKRERIRKKQLEEEGWTVIRPGWPDFLCYKKDSKYSFCFEEIKDEKCRIPQKQKEALKLLSLLCQTRAIGLTNNGEIQKVENFYLRNNKNNRSNCKNQLSLF